MIIVPEGGHGLAFVDGYNRPLFEYPAARHFETPKPVPIVRDDGAEDLVYPDPHPSGVWKGAFVLTLDLSLMRPTDTFRLIGCVRIGPAEGYLRLFTSTIAGDESRPAWQSRPLYSLFGCAFITELVSTDTSGGIALPWWVVQLDS